MIRRNLSSTLSILGGRANASTRRVPLSHAEIMAPLRNSISGRRKAERLTVWMSIDHGQARGSSIAIEEPTTAASWHPSMRTVLTRIVRVPVRIELLEINVLVIERVEPPRPQEWLRRLDQQDRLGKSAIVESTPEVHARFDGKDVEGVGIETDIPEGPGVHDLHEIRAQH